MNFVYFFGIVLLAFIAYKKHALTKRAMFVAIGIATVILFGFSLFGLIVLGSFFLSSVAFGKIRTKYGNEHIDIVVMGDERDFSQVLANGFWPACTALLYYFSTNDLWYYSYVASIAAVTSDTWASEIGKHSRKRPVHILTLKPIPTGQSGGISLLGTVAALFGSFFIIIVTLLYQLYETSIVMTMKTFVVIGVIGFLGQCVDTIVGATFQRLNRCDICGETTEKSIHCGKKTYIVKGLPWLTNDVVNHICSLSAIFFVVLYFFINR